MAGYLTQPSPAQPGKVVTIGQVGAKAPLKKWLLRSKGPNPKKYELRECKEELTSEAGHDRDRDQPGSSTDKHPDGGGKVPAQTIVVKAKSKMADVPPVMGARVNKPLGPRPRPRGESYQAMQLQLPENEGSPTSTEVEYFWNRNPVGKAKPKPPPPRLMEQFQAARKAVVEQSREQGWEPPAPPMLKTWAKGKAPIVPTKPPVTQAARKAPLRPMPYGVAPKPTNRSFKEVIEESSEGKMGKMGCSLQLCPIWVLREGEGNPQSEVGTAKVCAPKQSAKREQHQDAEVSIECEEVSSESTDDSSSPSKKMKMKRKLTR